MGDEKPHKIHLDLLAGKVQGAFGEFWFKYVGYCLLVATVYTASKLASSTLLNIVSWLSLLALYGWLRYQVERFFFYLWPETEPKWGYKPKQWQLFVANILILPMVFLAVAFGVKFAEIILGFKS